MKVKGVKQTQIETKTMNQKFVAGNLKPKINTTGTGEKQLLCQNLEVCCSVRPS